VGSSYPIPACKTFNDVFLLVPGLGWEIHQNNIADSYSVLSCHVCFLPLDQPLKSILAVHGDHCWALRFYPTYAFSQPRSLTSGASIERGPLVGEGILLASCVSEIGRERRSGAACGSASCSRAKSSLHVSFCSPSYREDGCGDVAIVAGYDDFGLPSRGGP
jgi:hypothetical protein